MNKHRPKNIAFWFQKSRDLCGFKLGPGGYWKENSTGSAKYYQQNFIL
jgi:hypothetical protein